MINEAFNLALVKMINEVFSQAQVPKIGVSKESEL